MPNSHPWSGFYFVSYFSSFCTPLLGSSSASSCSPNKQPCILQGLQPSSVRHFNFAHSIVQNSSEKKPLEKCRDFSIMEKEKQALKVSFRCVCGGGNCEWSSCLVLAKHSRATSIHNCLAACNIYSQLTMANTASSIYSTCL